jgi:DNA-3-methyladenine glycosylase II
MLAVAEAAVAGELDAKRLAQLARSDVERARRQLKQLPGIGPFYADLILIRATGLSDLLPADEPRFLALLGALYGLGAVATPEQAEQLARGWSPWRTWGAVLVRAAGPRVLGTAHRAVG